jgi:hypothetical protein
MNVSDMAQPRTSPESYWGTAAIDEPVTEIGDATKCQDPQPKPLLNAHLA